MEHECNVGEEVQQRADTVQLCELGVQSFHFRRNLCIYALEPLHDSHAVDETYPRLVVRFLLFLLELVAFEHSPNIFDQHWSTIHSQVKVMQRTCWLADQSPAGS